jgi:ABC-2 type transport system permease protein
MTAALINFISNFLTLSWLTGPIFDKELRVSSRKRRNYVLRFVYLALLTVFLVLVWLEEVKFSGSAVYRISRMAKAGQSIVVFIVWFQFCATQLIAIVMLSTSISGEIYSRTLGVLMTTPINSFQIVMGKLFSKLLQLILLLAISLPLLAIVRVFGGVPWDYIVSSLCITITTIIFLGSLSLFFSIFTRRAYVSIIMTTLTAAVIFALIPFLVVMLWETMHWHRTISEKFLISAFCHVNPYAIMAFITDQMFNPRAGLGMPNMIWQIHCCIMLAVSSIILAVSIFKVRTVALRQATGRLNTGSSKKQVNQKNHTAISKRVTGSPVLWKELRAPLFRSHKRVAFIVICISLVLLSLIYLLVAMENGLDDRETHMAFTFIFLGLGMFFTIILPATCITSEKESRSWPLLLATTLGDWQIIHGKFIGALRRCLPAWILLFGHIILFTFVGYIHPVAIVMTAILSTWVIVFFISTGIYFSVRFKHTTTAVVMNFVLPLIIWALVPILMAFTCEITHSNNDFAEGYLNIIPFVHTIVIFEGATDIGRMEFDWPQAYNVNAFESVVFMLVLMVVYISIAYLFLWRAKCRLRRNIF